MILLTFCHLMVLPFSQQGNSSRKGNTKKEIHIKPSLHIQQNTFNFLINAVIFIYFWNLKFLSFCYKVYYFIEPSYPTIKAPQLCKDFVMIFSRLFQDFVKILTCGARTNYTAKYILRAI